MAFPRLATHTLIGLTIGATLAWTAADARAQAVPSAQPAAPDIVGGQPADPGEYPWQVWLDTDSYFGPYCGGSLIAPDWAITAAHCVNEQSGPVSARPETVRVMAGDHDWYNAEGSEQLLAVERIVIHPAWNAWYNDNDIALLRLKEGAAINARVQPIGLARSPDDDAALEAGDMSMVTGWGAVTMGGWGSQVLMEVGVPIVSQAQCNESYPSAITENMICAGFAEGGKDTCQGDSGGPLQVQNGAGQWRLAGLTSFGEGCALPNRPGVYTRVSRYVEWIEAYVDGPEPLPLRDGGFEATDEGAWEFYAGAAVVEGDAALPPRSGQAMVRLGGAGGTFGYAAQGVALDTRPAVLRFFYRVRSDEAGCTDDRVSVEMVGRQAGDWTGSTLLATVGLCKGEETAEWRSMSLPLNGVAGQSVVIAFTFEGDGEGASSLLIDDAALLYTGPNAPQVGAFAPHEGEEGAAVTITGTRFDGVEVVRFGGMPAAFTVESPTRITAIVPAGAPGGPIRVSSAGGDDETTEPFTVLVPLRVERMGSGSGRVVLAEGAIDCGATCAGRAARGRTVMLEAAAGAGSTFGGWQGCDEGPGCTLRLTGSRAVSATFELAPERAVTVSGNAVVREPLDFSADTGLSPAGECWWKFGDGARLPCAVGMAAAAREQTVSATYAYNAPGVYTVEMAAANAAGSSAVTTTVTVAPTARLFGFLPLAERGE